MKQNLAIDLHFSQGQQKLFFCAIIHFTIYNAIMSEFGAYLAQNNIAQEMP